MNSFEKNNKCQECDTWGLERKGYKNVCYLCGWGQ